MKKKFCIKGMSCSACVAHVEKAVKKIPGVDDVNVNLIANTLELTTESVSDEAIMQAVSQAGYEASLFTELNYQKKSNKVFRNLIISICFLILLLYVAMGSMISLPLPAFLLKTENTFYFALTQIILLIPIVILNFHYFTSGFKKLFRRAPNMDSLVAIGATAAILYGIYATIMIQIGIVHNDMELVHHYHMELYFEGAGSILTLVSIGKYIEARSKGKTSDAISLLLDLTGKEAILVHEDDSEEKIPVEKIKSGDLLKVNAGMAIPVDGVILSGSASIDEASITGESVPIFKQKGENVISGTMNKDGSFIFRATSTSKDSTLAKIVQLVEEASSSKAPIARLADKVSGIFVPIVISIAVLAFIIWMIVSKDFSFSIGIAISVLVISCPCALGLATPIAIMIATGIAAKNHILIKNAEALEKLHSIKTIIMDKTGTITKGTLKVQKIQAYDDRFLSILKSLEKDSTHPIAQSIMDELSETEVCKVDDLKTIPGKGILGIIDQQTYYAGNESFIREHCQQSWDIDFEHASVVLVADEKHLLGYVQIYDEVKETSKLAISLFKKHHIRTIMLTGDNQNNAKHIQKIVGVDEVIADVLPEQKAEVVKKEMEKGAVLMIGDGINDSIALQSATIGMAIGAGSDIAIESADIVLVKNDLMDAYNAYLLSQKTIKNIKMNLFWAFFYNAIFIPIAAGVLYPFFNIKLNPMFAALAMSLSSVCVVFNALRLNRFKIVEEEKVEETIRVEGMMCDHCKKHVEDAIMKVDHVISVNANIKNKKVKIQYDGSLDLENVKKVVEEAGYQVK